VGIAAADRGILRERAGRIIGGTVSKVMGQNMLVVGHEAMRALK
jgi:hypothetical protein